MLLDSREGTNRTKPLTTMAPGGAMRGAEDQNRTGDTLIFSQVLYQLSYLGAGGDCTLR